MERILRILEDVTGGELPAGFGPDIPFMQLEGWDSMRAVNFQLELEQEFGVQMLNDEITGKTTLAELTALLHERKAKV